MRPFLLLILSLPLWAGGRTVTVRGESKETWIAWRKIIFLDEHGNHIGNLCSSTSPGSLDCSDYYDYKDPHWNANAYMGDMVFLLAKRPTSVLLVPCCGQPDGFGGLFKVTIKIRSNGGPWETFKRSYHLTPSTRISLQLKGSNK